VPGLLTAASKFSTSRPVSPLQARLAASSVRLVVRGNRLASWCRLSVVQVVALKLFFILMPGLAYAQELNSQNKDLDLASQPLHKVESVEVGTGSGSTHRVTTLSVVSPQVQTAPAPNSIEPAEQAAYDAALEAFRQAHYLDAAQGLVAFLQEYPFSLLADQGWYWLGESRYLDHGFNDAVTAMTTLLDSFPGSAFSEAARLRLGSSYFELRRYQEARDVLEDLLDISPDREILDLAKALLNDLAAQGY
jgi:TolA-binding protein